MLEIQGKYNNCKIFTDNCEPECISQLYTLLNQQCVEDSKIRIMPDCHAGAGCVIGTTMTITDKVIPNLVGVDLGCGMLVVELEEKEVDLKMLDQVIKNNIPVGMNINDYETDFEYLDSIKCIDYLNVDRVKHSMGTLGGGNHFIELDKDENDNLYLVIHTGSRYLGKQVAEYYQNEAWKQLTKDRAKTLIMEKVETLKSMGRNKDIQKELDKLHKHLKENTISKDLAYCEDDLLTRYLIDAIYAQIYALKNREAIASKIIFLMNLHKKSSFHTIHNYIDLKNKILRKGAVSAQKGEKLIIPMNMRDGSLICVGKGNPDWNYSAPHGAGRIMSRNKAKSIIQLNDYQDTMKGVYSTCVNENTIDESPLAYKPMEEIISNIQDTVEVLEVIKPIYNFKAY